jgi:hypothetical protein
MFHLVYVSSAAKPFSQDELVDLLVKARAKNSRLGITGMLLYKGGNFIQLLEGEEAVVHQLFATICQDPRHLGVIVLLDEPAGEPLFGDWSMGFRDLADAEVQALPGFTPFMNLSLGVEAFKDDPGGCTELLKLFRSGR